jgi:hypothetical protein
MYDAEALGRRLQTGQSLLQEVMGDVDARPEARTETVQDASPPLRESLQRPKDQIE